MPEEWEQCLAATSRPVQLTRLAVAFTAQEQERSIVNCLAAEAAGFRFARPIGVEMALVGSTKSPPPIVRDGPRQRDPARHRRGRPHPPRVNKAKARGISYDAMLDEALAGVSMRTTVTPQQIADAIVFICSQRGRTISGQAISVCGDTQILP